MKVSRQPKYDIGDEVKVISSNRYVPDFTAFVKGYEYYGPEVGDVNIIGYDYIVAYQLDDGEWEEDRFSEDFIE